MSVLVGECVDSGVDGAGCAGVVRAREALSASGVRFPRCDRHWEIRLDRERELRARYPLSPPRDWSPLDAGEAWSEDDY